MQQRIDYLDVAKAVAIFSVVAGHVLLFDLYGQKHIGESPLMKVLGSYHNYLFMFLSGMVSVTTIKRSRIPADAYKRFRTLIVPALAVGIPYAYWTGADVIAYFQNSWKWGYWYLYVLFVLYLVNYPFALIKEKYMKYIYVIIAPLWIYIYRHTYPIPQLINDILDIDFVVAFFPYFFAGSIVKRHKLHDKLFSLPVFGVCLVLVVMQDYIYDITGRYLINYIITFAEITAIITLCKWVTSIRRSSCSWIIYVGRNTLFIYLFHYIATNLIAFFAVYEWYEKGMIHIDIPAVLVPTIIAIVFSLAVKQLLAKSPLVMKLVFYKS